MDNLLYRFWLPGCRQLLPAGAQKVFRTYSAIAFASLSEMVFLSNLVMPGPGLRMFFTMSLALLIPLASLSAFFRVFLGLTTFPPSGWHTAQCSLNSLAPSIFLVSAKLPAARAQRASIVTVATRPFFIVSSSFD